MGLRILGFFGLGSGVHLKKLKPERAKARVEEKEDVVGGDADDEEKRDEVKDRQPLMLRQLPWSPKR